MTNTLASPPPPLRLSNPDISPVTPRLNRRQLSTPPSAAKTQIARRDIALSLRTRSDRHPAHSAPSNAIPIRDREIKSNVAAKSP